MNFPSFLDFCLPSNPCQHGGRCTSTSTNFACDCTGTGYTGATCTERVDQSTCTFF